ncbi:MAG TPA: putative Ig domain-containing protein [Bryobacteraceae bacterium]|nr:putative Ig domain-containing protein [Bryobacteraceae bacterium]
MWTSIGPAPITGSAGPTGRITSLAVDPSNSNHWLLGSAGGGIWSSANAGATWAPLTDAQPSLAIGSVIFAPGNPQIIYSGTGEATYTAHAQAGRGILKSTDGGTTWALVGGSTFARTAVGAIRVNPSNPNMLAAVMSRASAGRDNEGFLGPYPPPFGLQRSTDGGATWTLMLAGEATSLEVDPANFNTQFTAISLPAGYGAYNPPAPTGVYRSTDGGQTWTLIPGPWSGQATGRILVALAPSNANTLYVSVQDSNQHLFGIYRTDNALAATPTWIPISTSGSWATLGANYPDYCGNGCTSTDMIAVDPADPNTLYAGGVSLWRCSSCGASPAWTDIGFLTQAQGNLPAGKRCVAWSGSLLIACTDHGVFSTANSGVPWQDQNGGLSVARLVAGALHATNANFVLAGAFDNGAALWTGSPGWRFLTGANGEVALSASRPDTNMMTSADQTVFRSTDGGQTFVTASAGLTTTGSIPGFLAVRKCPAIDDVFLAGTALLQRSNNFFSSPIPTWTPNGPSGDIITAIAFAPSDSQCNTYAYGTATGKLAITTNGGLTWSNPDVKGSIPSRAVNSLAFDPTDANTLFAALSGFNQGTPVSGHLFRTGNALSNSPAWLDVSPGADLPFNVVAVDPSNPSSIFAGTDVAVWHSSDSGGGWQFLGPLTGMPNVPVSDLKFSPATGQLFAFTFGRGAWSLNATTAPSSGSLVTLPANTGLQPMLGSPVLMTLSAGGTPPYTYSILAGALPPGLVLLTSGQIQGTPFSPGSFTFTLEVRDANGGIASRTYTVSVGTTGTAPVWASLGPSPLAYSNCPTAPSCFNSGRVASIAVDPSDQNHWLIGVGNGGVWESHDAGSNWVPLSDGWPTLSIGAVTFAPSDPKTIYVGTGESDGGSGAGFGQTGLGIFKSTDGAKTWTTLAVSNFARGTVKRLRVHPTNPDVILAATSRGGFGRDSSEGAPSPPPFGILKSTNGGVTWTRTLNGQATALEIDANIFNYQYAAIGEQRGGFGVNNDSADSVPNGVYRSMDGGQTWALVNGPWGVSSQTTASVGKVELALAQSNPNVLYASIQIPPNGGSSGTGLLGLYRTNNAWDPVPTWTLIPTSATGNGGYCGSSKCGYSHVISVSPSNPDVLFAGGGDQNGFWRCTNCGPSPVWTRVDQPFGVHPDPHSTAWAGSRFILGNDGGVWSTPDLANSWQDHNAMLATAMFYSGALHSTNPDFMLGALRDYQVSLRKGTGTWLILPQPSPTREWGEAEVAMSSSRPDTDWAANHCCDGTISRTTDGGQTTIEADAGIDKAGIAFVAPLRKCPSNDDVFVTGTNRIWRVNQFFSSASPLWAANNPPSAFPSPNLLNYQGTILTIEFAPSDATCNSYAYGIRGGQIQLTRNGGNTWTNLDPAMTLPSRPVNGLAFDPTNANILYAAFSSFDDATPGKPGHLFRTTNALSGSPTWLNVSPTLNEPFNVIRVDPVNTKLIWAGSDTGLWRSNDGAATWIRQGPDVGIPKAPVYDIKINPTTGRTVVFTYGRGAYTLGPELTGPAENAATYLPAGLVAGSWATLTGTNLSGGSRIWADADFDGSGDLPVNLSGVQVTVNGLPAAVYYINPTQINFQVPTGAAGTVTVQVLRDGVPSNTIQAQVVSSSPGIFPIIANGTNYPAGVFLDGAITGDPAVGSNFRNAKPGDVIQLYATGLAPSPAGTAVNFQTFSGVTVTIGGVSFPADAAGLVAPGEFQINFTVPQQFASMAAGNYPISIQVNGVSTPTNINSNPPAPVVLPIQH